MMDQTTKSILELTQALVRIPSRAGVDSTKPIFDTIRRWLTKHGTDHEMLRDEAGDDVGLHGRIPGKEPGSIYLLDATVDTASYGDEAQWTHPPTAGVVEDGWLYGRGSADSKVGVQEDSKTNSTPTNTRVVSGGSAAISIDTPTRRWPAS